MSKGYCAECGGRYDMVSTCYCGKRAPEDGPVFLQSGESGDNSPAETESRLIGEIGNYYGGLSVKTENGKHYWSIENYDGHSWEEIPSGLFDALNAFEDSRDGLNP